MNKLGPHLTKSTPAGADWTRRCAIVKSLDDVGPFLIAPDHAIRVFRHVWTDQDAAARCGGEWMAEQIIAHLGGYNHPRLYVEIVNEWKQAIDELPLLCDITEAATRVLHRAGYKVAGFCFSSGNPTSLEHWNYIKSRDFCGVDIIALHEYWAKKGFSTWNALRYRRVHEWLGGQHPPFVITECGRDAIVDEGGQGQPGWKLQGVTASDYAKELLAYAAELERDDYVLGATVYTFGPWKDFEGFDSEEIAPLMPAASQAIEIPQQGGGTMRIAVALVPSNQNKNIGVISGYSEAGGMRDVLAPRLAEALERVGIQADVFFTAYESADKTKYENLHKACGLAKAHLDSVQADLKLCIHLHTDATPEHYSHTAYLYQTEEARKLGEAIGRKVQMALGTERLVPLPTTGYIYHEDLKPHTSVLIELCAHDNKRDLEALYGRVPATVQAIVDGVVEYAATKGGTCPYCPDLRRQLEVANDRVAVQNKRIEALEICIKNMIRIGQNNLTEGR